MSRIDFVRQVEEADCGPACLTMVLLYYRSSVTLDFIKSQFSISKLGVTIADIENVANSLGLKCVAIKTSIDYLIKNKPFPCILHWRKNHFIVLFDIKHKNNKFQYALVADPSFGILKLPFNEFVENWNVNGGKGIALILQPTKQLSMNLDGSMKFRKFYDIKSFILKYLKNHKIDVLKIVLLLIISSIIAWSIPLTLQHFIDKGFQNWKSDTLSIFILAQMGLLLGQLVSEIIRSNISIQLSRTLSVKIISDFIAKISRLPIAFFYSRNTSDLVQRIEDHSRIESFLSSVLIQSLFNFILFVSLSILLALYNPVLLVIFAALTLMSIIWVLYFLNQKRSINYSQFRLTYDFKQSLYEFITGIVEIKLNSAQTRKIRNLETITNSLYSTIDRGSRLAVSQSVGVSAIDQVKNVIITLLTTYWVANREISFGSMLSIVYIVGFLNRTTSNFIDFFRSGQDAILSIKRLNEISRLSEEISPEKQKLNEPFGDIVLKDVKYKFPGTSSQYVLDGINLVIPKGKTTAIVGSSGSGKSTMLKLILLFDSPTSGTLTVNGENLSSVNVESWRNECGAVMQDGYIFSSTIIDNVSLGCESIDHDKIVEACKIACIDEFINSLPNKYETKIGNSGVGLSGGQRQRILIARAVYRNPNIVLLDEATSALDSVTEARILENLNYFFQGKTVVIVAHRLSTIRNADQIVVVDQGRVVEVGTHEYLCKKKGSYWALIENQFDLSK